MPTWEKGVVSLSKSTRRIILFGAIAAIVVGYRYWFHPNAPIDPQAYDRRCRELLAKPGNVEARDWAKVPDKGGLSLGGESRYENAEAVAFVDSLYACGAPSVTAIQPKYFEGTGSGFPESVTDTLIVHLPDDKAQRRCIFEIERTTIREKAPEFDPVGEQGESYLLFWWD